jgi:hypothetical protein
MRVALAVVVVVVLLLLVVLGMKAIALETSAAPCSRGIRQVGMYYQGGIKQERQAPTAAAAAVGGSPGIKQ